MVFLTSNLHARCLLHKFECIFDSMIRVNDQDSWFNKFKGQYRKWIAILISLIMHEWRKTYFSVEILSPNPISLDNTQ